MNIVRSDAINQQQKKTEFISKRPEMISGKLTKTYTKQTMKKLWGELTDLLNCVPGGPAKEWKQWRKSWTDIKKNTKAKVIQYKVAVNKTGGGEATEEFINDTENIILDIITPVAIRGDERVNVSEIDFNFCNTNMDSQSNNILEEGVPMETSWFELQEDINTTDINKNVERKHTTKTTPKSSRSSGFQSQEHDYIATTHINENIDKKQIPKMTPEPKRPNKIKRLDMSLKNNEKILTINRNRIAIEQKFYERKLQIMEEEKDNRKNYQNRRLEIMERQTAVSMDLLQELRELKQLFLQGQQNL